MQTNLTITDITYVNLTLPSGNVLSVFVNPNVEGRPLLVVDLEDAIAPGGNEVVRMTLDEKKLLAHLAKQRAYQKQIDKDFAADGGLDGLVAALLEVSAEIDQYDPDDLTGPGEDEPSIDVRIQYDPKRGFIWHTGDSSYDTDHHGYWGASSVGPNLSEEDARSIAEDLYRQVLDDAWGDYQEDKHDEPENTQTPQESP